MTTPPRVDVPEPAVTVARDALWACLPDDYSDHDRALLASWLQELVLPAAAPHLVSAYLRVMADEATTDLDGWLRTARQRPATSVADELRNRHQRDALELDGKLRYYRNALELRADILARTAPTVEQVFAAAGPTVVHTDGQPADPSAKAAIEAVARWLFDHHPGAELRRYGWADIIEAARNDYRHQAAEIVTLVVRACAEATS